MKSTWISGLFDCGLNEPDGLEVCLCGTCCHSCLFGKVVYGLDEDTLPPLCSCECAQKQCSTFCLLDYFTFGLVSPCYSCKMRTKLRYRYKLEARCCSDCCAHFWCNRCAIVQDYVQLRAELRAKRNAELHGNDARLMNGGGGLHVGAVAALGTATNAAPKQQGMDKGAAAA